MCQILLVCRYLFVLGLVLTIQFFTCARIGDQVVNQGIIQSDTLKGSNKDTPMIPDGTGEYF
jgi:hypothetical protein